MDMEKVNFKERDAGKSDAGAADSGNEPVKKEITDYSAPLEQREEELKKLDQIGRAMEERLNYLKLVMQALNLMESGVVPASREEIKEERERLVRAIAELDALKKEENLSKEKIAMFLSVHKWMTDLLNEFESGTEH